jgi:hypothetical protein
MGLPLVAGKRHPFADDGPTGGVLGSH